jgi:hypothetical protein
MSDNIDALPKYDFEAQHRAYLEKCRTRYTNAIHTLPPRLSALGVAVVSASYSGCGDSGQIDGVDFHTADNRIVTSDIPGDLQNEVENFLYDALEFRHGGWENNDGGGGEFRWVLATNYMEHTHRDFYTETDSTYHEGFADLLDNEEAAS